MRNPFRKQTVVKKNVATLSPTETSTKGNYIGRLIQKRYYDFYNINHRVAVCKIDAIASRLTYKWADRATAKTFKFYTSHEVDGEETMEEIRAIWNDLNCNEILKKSITPMVRDGFVLLDLIKKKDAINYNVYGEYESAPVLWTWVGENKISGYKVQYTPHPRGDMKSKQSNVITANPTSVSLKAINKDYNPKELIHIEYGENNFGHGMPLIEGAWDTIIKLAIESNQQMLDKRSIPTLYVDESDVDEGNDKVKALLKMVANSDQDTARVWVRKTDAHGVVSEYPKFAMESPTANADYNARQQTDGISTGDFGNVSKEWGRLTTITGHSINYFMGNRAGATTGSETDKSNDDEQEIIDFGKIEVIIRKILEWLEANDFVTLPEESFVIKYWKDWERIEEAAKVKEEMEAQMEAGKLPGEQDTEPIDADNEPQKDKTNAINEELHSCVRNQMSYMMTPVVSHWIDEIGYYDVTDRLYMKLLTGVVYSKPAPMGEWSYLDWRKASSKGGYFWDYLSQRDPPWMKDAIPDELLSISEMTSNNKTITQKVPILDYKLINSMDTETKIKRLAKRTGTTIGTGTATKFKEMLNSLKKNATNHQLRFNTMTAEAFGNSIKEHYPLLYDTGDGIIVEEYICPDSWKRNVGKTVPLGVYHNLDGWNTPELPDWQIVGNAEIFGWDEEDGSDYVKYDYDYDKIDSIFKRLDQYDWLTPALKENGTSDVSTAYYCDIDVQWNEKLNKFIRVQVNIDLVSISFVPRGNCPGEVCSIKVVARNMDAMQTYIKNCIDEGMDREVCLSKAYTEFKAKT